MATTTQGTLPERAAAALAERDAQATLELQQEAERERLAEAKRLGDQALYSVNAVQQAFGVEPTPRPDLGAAEVDGLVLKAQQGLYRPWFGLRGQCDCCGQMDWSVPFESLAELGERIRHWSPNGNHWRRCQPPMEDQVPPEEEEPPQSHPLPESAQPAQPTPAEALVDALGAALRARGWLPQAEE